MAIASRSELHPLVVMLGLLVSCSGDDVTANEDAPEECVGGAFCPDGLVCVDGLCVEPGETGYGDGDGDGDGDSDGDGDGDGDGVCGDGVLDPGEACDDGNAIDTDACLSSCEAASCGDGIVGPGEGCDDGNLIDDDACTNTCALASCGDGRVQLGEQCDDQNANNDDACLDTCVEASCGDGFVHEGVESCDDQNAIDGDACLNSCELASCGDGVVHEGVEQCDDANAENGDTCLNSCVAAGCGDGFVGPGEGCDDGNDIDNDACTNACAAASCGDGLLQPGEDCDDGNASNLDLCLTTCVYASCSDGFVWAGEEQCDDGNADNGDGCLASCELASCGDGYVQLGVEQCDDGNGSNDDPCLTSCENASCGDGYVWADTEECDDQNLVNTDGCINTCQLASCGDGYVQPGQGEVCDAGDANADDAACLSDCQVAECGDGLVHAGVEQCDDGNAVPLDGCEVGCLGTDITVATGSAHTCVLDAGGVVRCWGLNSYGQLGLGHTGSIGDQLFELPPPIVDVGGPALLIGAGRNHTCVLLNTNELRCWGRNNYGQLGIGSTEDIGDEPGEMPPPAIIGLGNVVQIVMGNSHTCVLNDAGGVRCWGASNYGQSGVGSNTVLGDAPGEVPPPLVNLGGTVVELSAAYNSTCARLNNGKVRCWGEGSYGQLGYGNQLTIGDGPGEMPPADVNLGATATGLASGNNYHCAALQGGNLRCWGRNNGGQLGQGHTNDIGDHQGEMPPVITNVNGVVEQLDGGGEHICTILEGGVVRCWGSAGSWKLGFNVPDGWLATSPARCRPPTRTSAVSRCSSLRPLASTAWC